MKVLEHEPLLVFAQGRGKRRSPDRNKTYLVGDDWIAQH